MIIAIDGPAGCGKSTIAKLLAEKFNLLFLNTGNFYRAVSLGLIKKLGKNFDFDSNKNEKIIVEHVKSFDLQYSEKSFFLDGVDVSKDLRTDDVEKIVAQVSAIPELRDIVNKKIRESSAGKNIVCEGRDIGLVVFPNADIKFYLTASLDVRAKRRFDQGTSKKTLTEIKEDLNSRDEIDKNKKVGGLKIAKDAVYLDNSHLTISEICDRMAKDIYSKGLFMEKEVEKGALKDTKKSTQARLELLKEYDVALPKKGLTKGRVVVVLDDIVYVDIGAKAEGRIPIEEFDDLPEVGDELAVLVERTEPLVVSKEKADRAILRNKIRDVIDSGEPIEGVIAGIVKGGFEVVLPGKLKAFLPTSQTDTQRIENPEAYIGLKSNFLVEKFSFDRRANRDNIVVNRRKFMEKIIDKNRERFFLEVGIGDVVKGVVKSFTSFGAFIDLGGFDGLLHINDMSWGHVIRPRDFVKKGQEVELKVVRLDPEEKRINLSLKHFAPDPWISFEDKFQVNDIVKGTVTKIANFGAFIEIAEGIEGLAHISEFSWLKKINDPGEVLKEGDEVECMILGYDIQAGRVSLGLKQVKPNPWDNIDTLYPEGAQVKGKVVKLTNAGCFVQLQEGIDGFLRLEDISWTKRIKHPSSELKLDDELDVIILESNPETRRIRVGLKQLTDEPWTGFSKTYPLGAFIEGEITSITDFGVFVKVPGDIEGLIHKHNLIEEADEDPDEALKKYAVGDKIKAVVVDFNPKEKRVAFSVKDYKKRLQEAEVSKYMATSQDDEDGFTLGDLVKSKKK